MDASPLKIDWVSPENDLVLNPRLSAEMRARYWNAWKSTVVGNLTGQIGIATSGSSGDSFGKLIVISKSALLVSANAVNEQFRVGERDVWLKTLPSFHVGGLGILARAHLSGSKVVESHLLKWNPTAFQADLESTKATLVSLVPTQLYDLVRLKLKPNFNLRAVIVGGGALSADLHEKALELGWPVFPSYGLTECGSQVATARRALDPRLFPLSHVDIRISENGLIEIRSAALLTGQVIFRGEQPQFVDPKNDGWLTTEDRGEISDDGSLTVLGRSQDFIKIGGEGVILSRLQETFSRISGEFAFDGEAALLAAADERLGAVIVLLTNCEASQIQPLVEKYNNSVLPFERIRSVFKLASIPRSPLGKILRTEALNQVGLKPASDI